MPERNTPLNDTANESPRSLPADFRSLQHELEQMAKQIKPSTPSQRDVKGKLGRPTIFIRGK